MWALCVLGVRLLSCCKVRSMAWHITQQQRDGLGTSPARITRLRCALYARCALGVSAASDPPKCRLCGVVTLPKSALKWDWALTGASCRGMRCPGQQLHSVASRFAHHSFARMLRAWASTASSIFFSVWEVCCWPFVGTRLVLP